MPQLLQNAIYGTALILAVALLRRGLGQRLTPGARLALWGLCLLRLLAPVFPASGFSLWGLLPRAGDAPAPTPDPVPLPSGTAGDLTGFNTPAVGTVTPAPAPIEPVETMAFPWGTVLLAVWAGVGLLLAVHYALSYARTRRAVGDTVPLGRDDPRYKALPKWARLREGVMDGAPLTFGAVRPTVVLPPGLAGGELNCVLAHESVHAKRRDNLWHYVMALALVVYWWNPAVWLMSRLLRRDIELACDRAALKRLGADRRAEYAETLVAMATAGSGPAFCQTFGRKAAEERIVSIMKYKKTTIFGVVLSLALVLGVTAAFASAPKAPAEDGDPNNNASYEMCANPLCTVDYQHCHIDGEVVRAYDEYPGLLCAHPDCDNEQPHEHDGVEYAGQAGKYVILNPELGPVASSVPADLVQSVKIREETGEVEEYTINLDILKQNLDRHVAEGTMSQADADRIWALSQDAAQGKMALVWSFQGDSGLTLDELHNVCYRDENGKLVPVDPADVACGFMFPAEPPKPLTLEEYKALLDDLVSGGKMTQEDHDWFVDSAAKGLEGQTSVGGCPYLWATEDGSYAIRGGNICTLAGCGDNSRHTHDGEWYTGWTGKQTVPPICVDEDCGVSGTHYHENGEVVLCYDVAPALLSVCPVDGCTVWGTHDHDGVTYLCNGGHCGGVCDGNCHNWDDGAVTPAAVPASSGHHSEPHHANGHHGGHH